MTLGILKDRKIWWSQLVLGSGLKLWPFLVTISASGLNQKPVFGRRVVTDGKLLWFPNIFWILFFNFGSLCTYLGHEEGERKETVLWLIEGFWSRYPLLCASPSAIKSKKNNHYSSQSHCILVIILRWTISISARKTIYRVSHRYGDTLQLNFAIFKTTYLKK